MIFLGSVGVFFVFFAEPVIRLFTNDPTVVPLAASCLRIISYGNIGYAYGMVMLQAFNGAGDTVTPTIVNLFRILVAGDSVGVRTGGSAAFSVQRSVFRDRYRGRVDRGRRRVAVSAWTVEAPTNLTRPLV